MRHISNKKGKCAHFFKERALGAEQIIQFFCLIPGKVFTQKYCNKLFSNLREVWTSMIWEKFGLPMAVRKWHVKSRPKFKAFTNEKKHFEKI